MLEHPITSNDRKQAGPHRNRVQRVTAWRAGYAGVPPNGGCRA